MRKSFVYMMLLLGLVGIAFIFQFVIYGGKPTVVSGWVEGEKTQVVLPNHVWEIEFSERMDPSTLTEQNIVIKNEKDEVMATTISVRDDQKAVTIAPPKNGYKAYNGNFVLHLSNQISSVSGEMLRSDKTIEFSVSEGLPVVGSEKKLVQFFRDRIKETKEKWSWGFGSGGVEEETTMESNDLAKGEGAESKSYSETNVQVQGVDEGDSVKTDGEYIYRVIDRKLTITKALPASTIKDISTISYSNLEPFQLYVDENKLVVIGYAYHDYSQEEKDRKIAPIYQQVQVIVYDIADRSNPKEIRSVQIEGSYMTSRKVDSTLYIVNQHYPDFWAYENEKIDLRPRFADTAVSDDIQVIDYDEIHYFPGSNETNYSIIAALDIEDVKKEMEISTYLGSGSNLYMTKENLYIAVNKYPEVRENKGFSFDSIAISTPVKTEIYKFAVDGLKVEFMATGLVKGSLLNQFSMDEYNGHFRVATTEGEVWDEKSPSRNHVFILNEEMQLVGSVEDLARGERIYSVRFMGDKGYVVTFKQVDPLFVMDLSSPSKPTVLGELKIPGFSDYLHPYDEHHLIGFGQHTKLVKEKGSLEPLVITDGVKISLFDVSNPLEPKEKFSEIIGGTGTYSPLNYDHKALLFSKKQNIFAFPVTVYQDKVGSKYEQQLVFHGALAYSIDLNKGFQRQLEMTHEDQTSQYENWENQIMRVLSIEDHIYAVSPTKITAHKIDW
ncbi:beta-propeller domain-containing protein [Bacillus pinisoli]|uniref:beta-propeller domain-containing protein n=1 Tax=Bacillus pinisoli TaxID=2901866 RepID=UPI001FF2C1FC|nr:beta-propeller domain-containing protein [Bacillus pinisoli]